MTKTEEEALAYMRNIAKEQGAVALLNVGPSACGCMGPREGETKCPCAITQWAREIALKEHLKD